MRLYLYKNNDLNIARISQLTQKTNQFNLTTKRYTHEDILKLIKNKSYRVFSIRLIDKFGDYGFTGVVILNIDSKDTWTIDTFLLSCRILGRNIEQAILAFIVREAKKEGAKYLIGEYILTNNNQPAKDFYKNMGLRKHNEQNKELWSFDLKKNLEFPKYIKTLSKK